MTANIILVVGDVVGRVLSHPGGHLSHPIRVAVGVVLLGAASISVNNVATVVIALIHGGI